jgi:SAM-dependent methyltransferase
MSSVKEEYALGHTDRERHRLTVQGKLINPLTERFLQRAGLSRGMRVLDVGCSVGEVSLIIATLVGPTGYVHGVDVDEMALTIARQRCRESGYDNVRFETRDLTELSPLEPYDAVIGRHILIHLADPLAALRKAVAFVRPGGLVAFQEVDFCIKPPSAYPPMPLMAVWEDLWARGTRLAFRRPDIGSQLFLLMQEAGLPPPECHMECVMGGGPDSLIYEWFVETWRSAWPRMATLGLKAPTDLRIETLTERVRAEALEHRGVLISSPMIGAFARKQG